MTCRVNHPRLVYIPMERDDQKYVVIDTAGVRRRGKVHETVEKFSVIKTLRRLKMPTSACWSVTPGTITDQDLSILGFVLNSSRCPWYWWSTSGMAWIRR